MATTIYAHTNDGWVKNQTLTSWADTRDAGTGDGSSSTGTGSSTAVRATRATSGRAGYSWIVYRTFMIFDTSAIVVEPSSVTLNMYKFGGYTSADFFVVKSTIGTLYGPVQFDAIEGWTAGDNSSNVTKYSDEVTTWGSAYNTVTLNATARSDIASLDTFKIALIEADHDLTDIEPTSANVMIGMYYTNYTGTSRDPYISVTEGVADNATFFGANF